MNKKSVLMFLTLVGCFVFFILVNLTVFWVVVAFITAFAYFVSFRNFLNPPLNNYNLKGVKR